MSSCSIAKSLNSSSTLCQSIPGLLAFRSSRRGHHQKDASLRISTPRLALDSLYRGAGSDRTATPRSKRRATTPVRRTTRSGTAPQLHGVGATADHAHGVVLAACQHREAKRAADLPGRVQQARKRAGGSARRPPSRPSSTRGNVSPPPDPEERQRDHHVDNSWRASVRTPHRGARRADKPAGHQHPPARPADQLRRERIENSAYTATGRKARPIAIGRSPARAGSRASRRRRTEE